MYAVYAPVHHALGRIHPTAADAQRDEEAGTDKPPAWSVQPRSSRTTSTPDPNTHESARPALSDLPSRRVLPSQTCRVGAVLPSARPVGASFL